MGKEETDNRVERSLYQRAIGYEQDSVKIFMPKDAVVPVYAPYREKVAADTTACIFWLKNRKKNEWRDRQEIEHTIDENLAIRLEKAQRNALLIGQPSSPKTD